MEISGIRQGALGVEDCFTNSVGSSVPTFNMVENSVLDKEQYEAIQGIVEKTSKANLTVITEGISNVVVQGGNVGDLQSVKLSSDHSVTSNVTATGDLTEGGGLEFLRRTVVNPSYTAWFKISDRILSAINKNAADSSLVTSCAYAVANAMEDGIINGHTSLGDDSPFLGFRTAPGLQAYTGLNDWTADSTKIESDVLAIISLLQGEANGEQYTGPYVMLVGTGFYGALNKRINNLLDTEKEALMRAGIISKIVASKHLPKKSVVIFQDQTDTLDYILTRQPTAFQLQHLNSVIIGVSAIGCLRFAPLQSDGKAGVVYGSV